MDVSQWSQNFQDINPMLHVPRHKSYAPCAMFTPFTGYEIYEAAKSMKNGKSSGIDDIHAEHIK